MLLPLPEHRAGDLIASCVSILRLLDEGVRRVALKLCDVLPVWVYLSDLRGPEVVESRVER